MGNSAIGISWFQITDKDVLATILIRWWNSKYDTEVKVFTVSMRNTSLFFFSWLEFQNTEYTC